jgi:hypothetical protein
VYAAFAALTQLGIAVQLTGNTLLIVLAGAALALGLAFGLGGREMAGQALSNLFSRDNLKKPATDPNATGSNGMGSNGTGSNGTGSNGTAAYPAQGGGYQQPGQPEQHPAAHSAGWSNGTQPQNGNWQSGQ